MYLKILEYINTIGMILNFFAVLYITKRISKKSFNPVKSIVEDTSEEAAVNNNSFVVTSFGTVIFLTLFLITRNRVFLQIWNVVFWGLAVVELIGYIPMYVESLKSKNSLMGIPEKLWAMKFGDLFLQTILFILFSRKLFDVALNTLRSMNFEEQFIDIIIIAFEMLLTYIVIQSVIISLYCIVGGFFSNSNIDKNEKKLELAVYKRLLVDEKLKQEVKRVDRIAEETKLIERILLAIKYYAFNVKIYFLKNKYMIMQTFYYVKLYCIKLLKKLLNANIFNRFSSVCRNMLIVIVLILFNIYLYLNYDSNMPVVHFYELLSTVIIIPILLGGILEK